MTNVHLHRASVLINTMPEDQESALWLALQDAVVMQLHLAFEAGLRELAESYGVKSPGLEGLRRFNPDMAELGLVDQLLADSTSWLSQNERQWQQLMQGEAGGASVQMAQADQLITSDNRILHSDTNFYRSSLQNMQALIEQFRQNSQFY